ncbi:MULTISPECIES: nucleotide disphospho-sugar-binding domain-containing protein [unclassified Mycobacterium]|uniref:glycosyltransferase n=1 Tax=unclassified Mycobacterium TaxID=2642494 RepID=UPI00073FB70C|nr:MULTISPECIES: nucleotide disphospho-sugar-binding domain-containing protein [unclassified Mycobacterium]KUH82178.1 glycosyl transferase [Mycobacterium sp. GA-0227b]KUH86563.1 glycosyl transferase [Mycobacterium sp. GA-1999]KUH88192.1 glycosyl transferase [Mycobacterium sp. IS-1556]
MATILAYTSPALGHMLPMSALLSELSHRGHTIHLRTLSSAVDMAARLGFDTAAIDPRIESIPLGDGDTTDPRRALQIGVAAFGRRAVHEVTDLGAAIADVAPDALLIDVNCWGARSAAEAGDIPWACFSPYTPPMQSPGVPPFGLGLKPIPGALGRARDAAIQAVVSRSIEKALLPAVNRIRADVGLPAVKSADEYLRRAPLMFVATGKPFQYEQTDWGDAVHMIGPCALDPASETTCDWLAEIDRPLVLVTTSSEPQADAELVSTAVAALADEPVHVIATVPTGPLEDFTTSPNTTVCGMVPHEAVLARAVCAITHGGMGATQKALLHGVPVCVVPFGRDQFEVARRVEVARCGTRLPAKKLTAPRLRTKVQQAQAMTDGAKRVAAGFEATGGTSRGADLFEQRILR